MSNNWPKWWQEFYGELPPVGHILRETITRRWFRIHSLPDSKRYPENEEEYALLLARHNSIATEVLVEGAQCTLFFHRYHDPTCKIIIRGITPEYCGFFEEPSDDWDDTPDRLHIWQAPVIWKKGSFDELIRAVADWREPSVIFACQQTGRAYCPYDGGADLFLESRAERSALKRQYREWLSAHQRGL
jgi:hypothetical protein